MDYDFEYEYEVIADKTDLDELKARLAHIYTELSLGKTTSRDISQLLDYIDQTVLRLNIIVYRSDILYLEDSFIRLSDTKGSDYSGLEPLAAELNRNKRDLYRAERIIKK